MPWHMLMAGFLAGFLGSRAVYRRRRGRKRTT